MVRRVVFSFLISFFIHLIGVFASEKDFVKWVLIDFRFMKEENGEEEGFFLINFVFHFFHLIGSFNSEKDFVKWGFFF